MNHTPRARVPLALLISFTAAAGGCSASRDYAVPSVAEMYRDRMRYEYEVRNQPQPASLPAAAVGDLPGLLLELGLEQDIEPPAVSELNPPG